MNKSDIIKAGELSYEEMLEKAAKEIAFLLNEPIERAVIVAQAALKAAGIDHLLKTAELLKQVEVVSVEDIADLLHEQGCYVWREDAIKKAKAIHNLIYKGTE